MTKKAVFILLLLFSFVCRGQNNFFWSHTYSEEKSNVRYGYLYNWHAVNTGKLAPSGWHVPSRSELTTLNSYCANNGYNGVEGLALKSNTDDWASEGGGDDAFGWFGLPGGRRVSAGHDLLTITGMWWSSTYWANNSSWYRYLRYDEDVFTESNGSENHNQIGRSIRCIRDNSNGWSEGDVVEDYDGNTYETIQIGNQIWMVQNLATTHYNDGTSITHIVDNQQWNETSSDAYCAYNNDESYVFK